MARLHVLDGAHYKLKRAGDQIKALERWVQYTSVAHEKRIVSEIEPETGDTVWYFRGTPRVPWRYAVAIGEVLFNMRSALVNCAWRLVEESGSILTPEQELRIQ